MTRRLCALALILGALALATPGRAQDSHVQTDGRSFAPLDSFKEGDACPLMIVMPPGSFLMGAKPGDSRNLISTAGACATCQATSAKKTCPAGPGPGLRGYPATVPVRHMRCHRKKLIASGGAIETCRADRIGFRLVRRI